MRHSQDMTDLIAAFKAGGGQVKKLPPVGRIVTGIVVGIKKIEMPILVSKRGREGDPNRVATIISIKSLGSNLDDIALPDFFDISSNKDEAKILKIGATYHFPVTPVPKQRANPNNVLFWTKSPPFLPIANVPSFEKR